MAGAVTLGANRFLRPNSFLASKLYQRGGHKSYPDLKPHNTCLSGHKVHQPGLTDQHEVREGGKKTFSIPRSAAVSIPRSAAVVQRR